MEGRGAYLRVGLLVLVGTALLIVAFVILAGNQLRGGTPFESYFRESVQGLEVGSPVKYLGVTLGRVTDISLVSAVYGRDMPSEGPSPTFRDVYVRFVLDITRIGRMPDLQSAIDRGLRAKLAAQGLTGLSYIELDFVNPAQYPPQAVPWTPRNPVIPTVPSTLAQVSEAGQEFLAKLNRIEVEGLVRNADGLLTDLRGDLKDGDIHRALAQLDETLAEVQTQLQQADVPGLSADARRLLNGPQTRELIANANAALEKFSAASSKLGALIATFQTTAQRANNITADLGAELGPILRDLQAVMNNLREATAELRRYPAGALLGGPPPRERQAR